MFNTQVCPCTSVYHNYDYRTVLPRIIGIRTLTETDLRHLWNRLSLTVNRSRPDFPSVESIFIVRLKITKFSILWGSYIHKYNYLYIEQTVKNARVKSIVQV